MSGGKGGSSNTVEKADPWEGIQPYLLDIYERAQNQSRSLPSYYPGQTVADVSPYTTQSWDMMLGAANNMGNIINPAMFTNQYLMGDAMYNPMLGENLGIAGNTMGGIASGELPSFSGAFGGTSPYEQLGEVMGDPTSNPYYSAATRALMGDLAQTFKEQVLPGIRGEAINAGQFGGSRQGVAEGLATQGLMESMLGAGMGMYNTALDRQMEAIGMGTGVAGDAVSRMLEASQGIGDLYGGSTDTMLKALGLSPQTMSMGLTPAQIYGQVGGAQTAQEQAAINEAMQRYFYNQQAPWSALNNYTSILAGIPTGAFGTSEMSTDTASNPAMNAAATGMGTYGLYSAGVMNPYWAVALPIMSYLFS